MAKKRRKHVPVGGWFVNYNAGDVETANKVFNAAADASESPSTNPTGPMGEAVDKDIDWENVQWGVHQFSTNSIIFRGTEEDCKKYINDKKELWDDAEVYYMTPDDPHYIREDVEKKWNIGSDKEVRPGSEEYELLQELAAELTERLRRVDSDGVDLPEQYMPYFEVETCYEDYGAGMKWATIIYHYPCDESRWDSYQFLNPAQWLDLANKDKSVQELADELVKERKRVPWANPITEEVEETAVEYTDEEIVDALVEITKNYTVIRPLRTEVEREKDVVVYELKKHFSNVEVSDGRECEGADNCWIITYNNAKEVDFDNARQAFNYLDK